MLRRFETTLRPRRVVSRVLAATLAMLVGFSGGLVGATPASAVSVSTARSGVAPAAAVEPSTVDASIGDSPPAAGSGGGARSSAFGLTVSWSPTTAPVRAKVGGTATGKFWVTNTTKHSIPVQIHPAIAVPGNDGQLSVRAGVDKRFSKISYTPNSFTARPQSTTTILVTVTIPSRLGPGVYLIPGIVHPTPPRTGGGIRIEQDIIAPVTFQIPGTIRADLNAAFIPSTTAPRGTVVYDLPGLPAIEIGPTGTATLRVTAHSAGSLYSYAEITANQRPFGTTSLDGHTVGRPTDLRLSPALFFPGVHRDYPITWRSEPFGVGMTHLNAYVSYDAGQATRALKPAGTSVLLVSSWWFLSVGAYLTVLLIHLTSSARRQSRPRSGRRRRAVRREGRAPTPLRGWEWPLLAAVTAALVPFGSPVPFLVAGACGLAIAVAGMLVSHHRPASGVARMIFLFHTVTGLLIVAGIVVLVVASLYVSGPMTKDALALLAATGVWCLIGGWLQRLNWRRVQAGTDDSGPRPEAETPPGRSAIPASGPASDGTPSPETVL